MPADTDSVHGRIALARGDVSTGELATGLAVVAAVGFALLFLGEPTAHDALHNFRHGAGVVCH